MITLTSGGIPDLDPKRCLFCTNRGKTDEHIIPVWLLNKYDLWNQRFFTPDGVGRHYKNLKVPACERCNRFFGKIEDRVRNGMASDLDIYIWTLKIRVGLTFYSSYKRSHRLCGGYIYDISKTQELLLAGKIIFTAYRNNYKFIPEPPGSVIRIKRECEEYFDFVEVSEIDTIGISFLSEYIYCLHFDYGYQKSITDISKYPSYMSRPEFRFFAIDIGYNQERLAIEYTGFIGEEAEKLVPQKVYIAIPPVDLKSRKPQPFDNKKFKSLLRMVSLNGEYIEEDDIWKFEFDESMNKKTFPIRNKEH